MIPFFRLLLNNVQLEWYIIYQNDYARVCSGIARVFKCFSSLSQKVACHRFSFSNVFWYARIYFCPFFQLKFPIGCNLERD